MRDHAVDHELHFCRLVCTGKLDDAGVMLQHHPELLQNSVHCAAVWGETASVAAQLQEDASRAHTLLSRHWSPLMILSMSHCARPGSPRVDDMLRCAQLLLESGADVGAFIPDDEIPAGKLTALAAAAGIVGNRDLCAALLEAGAPANDGAALFVAAAEEHWDCVTELVSHGGDLNACDANGHSTPLHWILDWRYSTTALDRILAAGADPNQRAGGEQENALHVAVRRHRINAVQPLLDHGVDLNARTAGGMTAYRHALRRSFDGLAKKLTDLGADSETTPSDAVAIALHAGRLDEARTLLQKDPKLVASDTPEEARLVADLAGGGKTEAVRVLLDAGVDIAARGLDGGTPLHQAAWFGQPDVARLLVERGAPLAVRGDHHDCTPLGWAAHGSRFSGGAEERSDSYVRIAEILLQAGAPFPQAHELHDRVQFGRASEPVTAVLQRFGWSATSSER